VPIPLRLALFDRNAGTHGGEQLLTLEQAQASVSFPGFAEPPVLSINRGFSAPVAIEREVSLDDLVFLAAHDDDPLRATRRCRILSSAICATLPAARSARRIARPGARPFAPHSPRCSPTTSSTT
jgi:aminopeptidase N